MIIILLIHINAYSYLLLSCILILKCSQLTIYIVTPSKLGPYWRRSTVNFGGGEAFLPLMYEKLTKCWNSTRYLPEICPNFTLRLPEEKYFSGFLLEGGGNPLPGAGPQAPHQLNPALFLFQFL